MNSSRTFTKEVSVSNIRDQIASLMYQLGLVGDDEEVVNIEFGSNGAMYPFLMNEGTVSLRVTAKADFKRKEVTFTEYNGQGKKLSTGD